MDIQSAINTPFVRLRLIGFVHFSLLVNAMMDHWFPPAYTFYNTLFMLTLIWAVHCRESIDAIHVAAAINFSSLFFDLVIILSFFSHSGVWSMIFAIINLAARPFSLVLLHKELVDRGGDFVLVSVIPNNNPEGARSPRSYQDIDNTRQGGVPQSQSGQSNISNLF